MLRQQELYFGPKLEKERERVIEMGDIGGEKINGIVADFHNDAINYLSHWTSQFEIFDSFSWVNLRSELVWPKIQKAMLAISEADRKIDLDSLSPKVFDQFGQIKKYCTSDKLDQWKNARITTPARWVEVFKHFEQNEMPYLEFSRLVEFILCVPGSSAPVERVFSTVKNIWKTESTQLHIETLKAMLLIKSLSYDCVEFFELIKKKPELLKCIRSQQKYSFKR